MEDAATWPAFRNELDKPEPETRGFNGCVLRRTRYFASHSPGQATICFVCLDRAGSKLPMAVLRFNVSRPLVNT